MIDLRETFLKAVTSSYSTHVAIADTDRLLDYPDFREALIENGYRIIEANDGLEARIKFELEIRGATDPAVLVVSENWNPLPDIKEQVHFVRIGLRDLVPKLSPDVIRGLGFEALERLSQEKQYADLNEDQTLSYVFKVLYRHDLDTLRNSRNKEYVLSVLIDIVLDSSEANERIERYLEAIIRSQVPGKDWELNRVSLLNFLQEQWEQSVAGSGNFDFSDSQLQKNILNLFATGQLAPVKVDEARFNSLPKPLSIGCYFDVQEYKESKFAVLIDMLENIQGDSESFDFWRQMISVMADAALLSFDSTNTDLKDRYSDVSESMNRRFQDFIESGYDKLFSLSGVKRPSTVTKVLEHLKFHSATRKALLVLDGVNYWQWTMIAEALRSKGVECRSDVTTAFIPTITAWSRQAIFKGSTPDLTADNSKEEKLFRSYWSANGYKEYEIGFEKLSFGNSMDLMSIADSVKILGLVSNDLDDLMHAALMGNRQLQSATAYWLENSSFIPQVQNLKQIGFTVFVTTDHGSIEAKGTRNLKTPDNVGSISRSKRHTHFRNDVMLANFKQINPDLDFGVKGLSAYLRNSEAFTIENDVVVTHGGSHFWEVLIPFVEI